MIFNKNLPTSMRVVGARVVRALAGFYAAFVSSVCIVFSSQRHVAIVRSE